VRLARPLVGEEELAAIREVLDSGVLTNGPRTAAFEDGFARRHRTAHAVAFANGTVALAGMLLALGIGPGDEVIVPSVTFVSTATSVLHVGATPVFAEIDPRTFDLDPADVRRRISARTKAILVVHYAGQPADMAALRDLAADAGVLLLEDAAEAHGAAYRGRPVGGLGAAAMFSFTPTKNITTGEGGIVTTDDGALAQRLRLLRNHGQSDLYRHELVGYNWRITEMQAAMGLAQLARLDGILARKRANAEWMARRLAGVEGVTLPLVRAGADHVYMMYTVLVDAADRDAVLAGMLEQGVEARVYFPPVHRQPLFATAGIRLPVTERVSRRMLSIPFHAQLTADELESVATALEKAVATAPRPRGS
jgi:perosamine synthetase